MKKNILAVSLMALALGVTSCGDDPEVQIPEGTADVNIAINDIDVTAANVANWTGYAHKVATLLEKDAKVLYADWSESYKGGEAFAQQFKQHKSEPYTSAVSCVEQIVDGCITIAGEVGTAKIGEPRDLWEKGDYTKAVYAVESWYSFHSIDDYANNIRSIENAFNGTRNGKEAAHSIAAFLKANRQPLYTETKNAIARCIVAIESMPAPFRNHIGNPRVLLAQQACADLNDILSNKVKPAIKDVNDKQEEELDLIVSNYVDEVVLPTYKELADLNTKLREAVEALRNAPSDATFRVAANAWMNARAPWEKSEAFLFGPVDSEGLDPNMDSWPLDQVAIENILKSGNYSSLEYGEDAKDDAVEAAQNVRGFHTLEFLLFKDGKARTYSK